MEKHEEIISALKESPFLKMTQSGLKAEEIKGAVIELLEPYFNNKDILEQRAIEALVPESISLLKLKKNEQFFELFEKCLSTYRLARSKDPQTCFESCALWQPQIASAVSEFWSILHLELDKSALEIEEFLHECLRNIGDIIEGMIKPYLKILIHQIRIANGIRTTLEDIDSLHLGVIVDELIKKSGYAQLFIPPPWNIRLNQWRNIAYHHQAKIENSEIVCWYGKAPKIKMIRLSKSELLEVVHSIYNVYGALRLADTLFGIDNLNEIATLSRPVELRYEAEFLNFAAAVTSQGFEIVECQKNAAETKLVVRDVSDLDPNKRRFHASQFLFHLWDVTRSRRVILEYREKDNTPNLLVSTDSTTCEKIDAGELEALALAKMADMVDLKTKKNVPPLNDG